MGRTSVGWRLRQRVKGGVYLVRFWCGGSESERSTGTRDPVEAAREASRIYADAISRDKPRRKQVRTFGFDLEECIAQWLVSLSATHDAKTLETWEVYATAHWVPHFSATRKSKFCQVDVRTFLTVGAAVLVGMWTVYSAPPLVSARNVS